MILPYTIVTIRPHNLYVQVGFVWSFWNLLKMYPSAQYFTQYPIMNSASFIKVENCSTITKKKIFNAFSMWLTCGMKIILSQISLFKNKHNHLFINMEILKNGSFCSEKAHNNEVLLMESCCLGLCGSESIFRPHNLYVQVGFIWSYWIRLKMDPSAQYFTQYSIMNGASFIRVEIYTTITKKNMLNVITMWLTCRMKKYLIKFYLSMPNGKHNHLFINMQILKNGSFCSQKAPNNEILPMGSHCFGCCGWESNFKVTN